MSTADPRHYIWWLASRASGLVALGLVTLAVLLGLLMATRSIANPALRRAAMRLHEHVAIAGLIAIAVHGLTLLGDPWLRPGLAGISIPFALHYRSFYTGLGVIAGYLTALLGLSYYVRRRIGTRRWRQAHRATVIAWALAAVHTLGGGSDAGTIWLRAAVLAPGAAIVYLFLVRLFVRTPVAAAPPIRADIADQVVPLRRAVERSSAVAAGPR